jgi:hypothetical protein
MGKVYEALLKNELQRQSENNQVSRLTAILQRRRSLPGQKIFSERFLLGMCLGLALCNMFVLLLQFLS